MGLLDRLRRSPGRAQEVLSAAGGPMRTYAETPLPGVDTPLGELPLLALDFETTGFDPKSAHLLSVGYVPVDGRSIVLGGARHYHVRPPAGSNGVGQSATIHGLTDDTVADGVEPREALHDIAAALAGRALLVHFASVETRFLARICRAAYGVELPLVVIDTMELARRMLPDSPFNDPPRGALRLWGARAAYGLPVYAAHNALLDALSCAELYLAQTAELAASGRARQLRHVQS
ncbi:MAG: exonuclease domain-containing protein [Tetrasphaera sp.]